MPTDLPTRALAGALLLLALAAPTPSSAQDGVPTPGFDLPRTPVLPDTVTSEEVTGENGSTALLSTGQPFTGMVIDRWENGRVRLRRAVVDGRPEGLWMEWYETGVPRYMATWAAGAGEGMWTYFHPTGEVSERAMVRRDRYDGLVEGWYASGTKQFDGRNRMNRKIGEWRYWTEEGELDRVEIWKDGDLVETRPGGA